MKKYIFICFIILILSLTGFSQNLIVTTYDPPIKISGKNGDLWGTDYLISSSEPFGKLSGICRATDTIFVAIPDTNIIPGAGLVIMKSSDNGMTWSATASVSPALIFQKTRMVKSGLDSIYCIFQYSAGLYVLKLNAPLSIRPFFSGLQGYRDYDCFASSTGGLYVFVDSLSTNDIAWYGSSNGGTTWNKKVLVSKSGAMPYVASSSTGDTAILMYYEKPFAADTTTSAITVTTFREVVPGQITTLSVLPGEIPSGEPKAEFKAAKRKNVIWLMYTSGPIGSRDLLFRESNDGGDTFGPEHPIANNPNLDEYSFDIKDYAFGPGGIDIIFRSDSTGSPSNSTHKLIWSMISVLSPIVVVTYQQFSEHPPVTSPRGYVPILIEYHNSVGNVGVVWEGLDGSNINVYYDKLIETVGIQNYNSEIPLNFSLNQNYPNPFNPVTAFKFALPKSSYAKLTLYDLLGKTVTVLVNEQLNAGNYKIIWDASNYSSGVYFYKLEADEFTETKKMILIK